MLGVLIGHIMSVPIPVMVMSIPVVLLDLSSKQLLVVFPLGVVLALPCGGEEVSELFTEVFAEVLRSGGVSGFV